MTRLILIAGLMLVVRFAEAQEIVPLPGTQPLTENVDFSDRMLTGFESYLQKETDASIGARKKYWKRDFRSHDAYNKSVQDHRDRLARLLGVVDDRLPIQELEYITGTQTPHRIAETQQYSIYAVRWPVLEGVDGEGLLLVPTGAVDACLICIPDADQSPEMLAGLAPGLEPEVQYVRLLATKNIIVIPTLIDRQDTWSGDPSVWMTNEPHREWVYRPAFELGRHIIGYEVQKVLALVDWFSHARPDHPIGVSGYGEGGLIAFYSAALDTRIDAALVSGYFDSRQNLWQEPIYRNVFGFLAEFGDAEVASLIAPRGLIIEHSVAPAIDGPPPAREGRRDVAAPGRIRTPELVAIRQEIKRFEDLCPGFSAPPLITGPDGTTTGPGSRPALQALLDQLVPGEPHPLPLSSEIPVDQRSGFDPAERQRRQLQQLVSHTQKLLGRAAAVRTEFWSKANSSSAEEWAKSCEWYRNYLWDEVLGRCPSPTGSTEVRTRKVLDQPHWVAYEVVFHVNADIIVWGYLMVPKDIAEGQRRPVVVCQHGLEGLPMDVITDDQNTPGYSYYKAFAARLAERGYVTFAPHHYYRGGDRFRQAQRMAYPLKKTLFALTIAQHEGLLQWLQELPFVDPQRIGFYGLSYGGFSAMRIPSIVQGYALSINSAEFNDMALKKASVHHQYSYPFHRTYEVFEFNLANTFGYADLAGLIAPRPFMVERGHQDGVAPDEWVAAEFAKVRRTYTRLSIGNRTNIEYFDGPHTIHGVGTFEFLDQHLKP